MLNTILSAHGSFVEIAGPFVNFLAKATSTCITLLSGAPPANGDNKFYVKAIHADETTPSVAGQAQKWSEFDYEGFKTSIKLFSKFLLHCQRTFLCFTRIYGA